jgi:hypothetical protein
MASGDIPRGGEVMSRRRNTGFFFGLLAVVQVGCGATTTAGPQPGDASDDRDTAQTEGAEGTGEATEVTEVTEEATEEATGEATEVTEVAEVTEGKCTDNSDCLASACETAVCDTASGECANELQSGYCLIGGACYTEGAENPENACEVCAPASATTAFATCPDAATACSDGKCRSVAGQSCVGDEDCASGVCTPTPDAAVCSAPCTSDEECAAAGLAGFGCDTAGAVCIHQTVSLCLPCDSDEACASPVAKDARCVELTPGGGRFCGLACQSDEECPTEYGCQDFEDDQGAAFKQCAPKTDACTCTAYHAASGATTSCGLGACAGKGEVTCSEAGKPPEACSAAAGAAETCDTLDNDCDGETDENFKDAAGKWSTDAHCGACGNACTDPEHGSSSCQPEQESYECMIVCEEGYAGTGDGKCELAGLGACEPCEVAGDCQLGLVCAPIGASQVCVASCGEGEACEEGYACKTVDEVGYCLRADTGACKASGEACQAPADCEDLNPCSVADCAAGHCAYANDDAYVEACAWPYGADTQEHGECKTGARSCAALVLGECVGQVAPELDDVCDGLDTDCDGAVDEDFQDAEGNWSSDAHCGGCGNACTAPEHGTSSCQPKEETYACALVCEDGYAATAAGTCELDVVGACGACEVEGDCQGGLTCATLGASQVCLAACGEGVACEAGYACKPVDGVSYCLRADAAACKAPGEDCQAPADCEDLNPCSVDACEAGKCAYTNDDAYSEACAWSYGDDTKDRGECKTGTRTCTAMALGECVGQVAPAPVDACNSLDDNCDGDLDEGCELASFDMCFEGATYLAAEVTLGGEPVQIELLLGSTLEGGLMSGTDANGVGWQLSIGLFPLPVEEVQ